LNANQLREIDVTGLENLRVLILAINQLENIRGLETLIHLERIYCHDNPLDIGAVYRALSNAKYLNTAIITSPEYKERDLQIIKGNLQRSEVF
jgi:Leucine-rich repeat (LRR) protein